MSKCPVCGAPVIAISSDEGTNAIVYASEEIGHIEGDDGKRHPITVADYDALAEQLAGAVEGFNSALELVREARTMIPRANVPVGRRVAWIAKANALAGEDE